MTTKKNLAISIFIAFFVFGFAAGFVTNELAVNKKHKRPRGHKNWLVEKFTNELSLNDEQIKVLEEAMLRTRQQHDSLNTLFEPHYLKIRDEFDQDFLKNLTEEQKEKFLEMKRNFENRTKKEGRK